MTDYQRRVRVGDPILAQEWNQREDRLRRVEQLLGIGTGQQPERVFPATVPFSYVSSDGDVLLCNIIGEEGSIVNELTPVAKPYTHRPSVLSRGGHTYSYTTDFERVDTLAGNAETQVLTPAYEVGDVIYATLCNKGTGVLYDNSGSGIDGLTIWLQTNVDGRAWAQKFGT